MNEHRGSGYLITGLVIGLLVGFFAAWFLVPVQPYNTSPAQLQEDAKDQYRTMIAIAFISDGDLVRARARLELLGDADMYSALVQQAQRTLAAGQPAEDIRALGILASALKQAAP